MDLAKKGLETLGRPTRPIPVPLEIAPHAVQGPRARGGVITKARYPVLQPFLWRVEPRSALEKSGMATN